jgi:hypothetical protein
MLLIWVFYILYVMLQPIANVYQGISTLIKKGSSVYSILFEFIPSLKENQTHVNGGDITYRATGF